MTEKKRQEIRNWLKERKEIYEKYAKELKAEPHPMNPQLWMVPEGDGMKLLSESKVMNTDTARSLEVNHAYYLGAMDALYGFGVLIA